jgi:hypothetical protein
MNKFNNRGTKIFLFLSVLSGSLWMGSYLSRIILSYQFFEGTDFTLKPIFNSQTLNGAIINLNSLIVLSVILYFVFIITFLLFLGLSKMSLKQNGWLFIITIIVFLTFPFEVYLMTIDFKIISQVLSGQFNSHEIINLIIDRFKVLSSFPLIELFCYASIIYFIIFQPLKLNKNEN